jgi:hypothetical protein
MGFVTGYENDVFISYAHADNEPLLPGKPGWVDIFEDLLRKRVRNRIRGEIQFFRDPQLRSCNKFSDELDDQLAKSAVLICILSPRYVESDWCLWELEQFYKRTGSDRIIKVLKTHFDEQDLKPATKSFLKQIEQVLDFRFFTRNESTGFIEDLMPEINPEHMLVSLQKIELIAQNLVELFKRVNTKVLAPTPDTIYLAETTKELRAEYHAVKSELLQHNYRVLPDQPLPLDGEELSISVQQYLAQAKLSVHLVGESYGVYPDGDERSVPHIQFDLAAALAKTNQLTQLVWLPHGLEPRTRTQQQFVSYLKNNAPDLLHTKLEDLMTVIHGMFLPKHSAKNIGAEQADDPGTVGIPPLVAPPARTAASATNPRSLTTKNHQPTTSELTTTHSKSAQPIQSQMSIFISYRRDDSADITGRLYDRLVQRFGKDAIFKDVDSIPLGVDFRKHLDEAVGKCSLVIAIIGPKWPGKKKGGKRRIDDAKDFVRIEIESALQREIPLIPILIQKAALPSEENLPTSLHAIIYRNAIHLRPDPDFHPDVDRLIKGIELHLGIVP